MRRLLLWMFVLILAGGSATRLAADPNPVNLISIVLEKRSGAAVQKVDPGHVFNHGDTIRFRVRPQVDAYLYVLDLNTSGRYDVLFPRAETGNDNRVEHGRDYLLPATSDGWFQVAGPAGHERLYFVLSPVALNAPQGAATPQPGSALPMPPQGTAPSTLRPRCNDGIFRARGECVDSGAGPQTVAPNETLPRDISQLAQDASRDLEFTRSPHGSMVKSAAPLSGPVVYEFLLAHN
jgi:hypothetical protein